MIKLITMFVAAIPVFFTGIIAFLARKWGVFAATATLMIALTVAFIGVINGVVASVLSSASLPGWAAAGIGFGIPSDFALCIGALVSSRIARAAYEMAMDKARMFNTAQ